MKFDEILKPTYEPQTITIRLSDQGQDSEYETNAKATFGRAFPVIRVGNTTFQEAEILGFNFSVGTSFLPRLTFRVQLPHNRLRANLKTILDNITFYMGNNMDEHFVKLDMLVLDSNAGVGSQTMSMECELHLPNLYSKHIRSFTDIKDALKTICEECKMGLLMNYEPPKLPDGVQIIQDGVTNIDMIKRLASYGSKDPGTLVTPFIDQQMYLCMWEITKLFKDTTLEKMKQHPLTGEGLSAKNDGNKLIISNQFHNEDRPFTLSRFVPKSNYAESAKLLALDHTISKTNLHTIETDTDTEIEHKKELVDIVQEQFNLPDEYRDLYQNIVLSKNFAIRMNQFTKMDVKPTYMIPAVYCGYNVKLEIFNDLAAVWYDDQENPGKTAEQIRKEGDTMGNQYDLRPNELFTGNYYLAGIEWNYNSNATRIAQTLHLISKMSDDELETHLKA